MTDLQRRIGETVILNVPRHGLLRGLSTAMGLELFAYFIYDYPEDFARYMAASGARRLEWVQAVADRALSPVILIAEDFATKQGPIFPPEFLPATTTPMSSP